MLTTLGDSAQFHNLRGNGFHLRTEMQRLTEELSTGRHADLGKATGGNFSAISDVTRSLRLNTAFATSISEAAIEANGRQIALDKIDSEITGYAAHILTFANAGSLSDMALAITNAPERFDQAVGSLNTRIAGKSLFAGDALDQKALISSEAMLTELRPLVAGAATASDVAAIVDNWFMDAGGGYETLAWTGGDNLSPVILREGVQEATGITALDPSIREVLSGLAMTALAAEGSGPFEEGEKRALVGFAASRIQSGESNLIVLRSDLGASQARIEEARVTAQATRAGLEIEHTRLTEADPYRTATDLEAVQTRLETLYILTSRISRLSLTEYLR